MSTGTQLTNVTHHFMQPFARTSAYQYSFFPNTISDWNSFPASICSCPSITAFKYNPVAQLFLYVIVVTVVLVFISY